MRISFVIIAYNEERVIGRCIDAIIKQDNLSDYEVVVVNDGSIDNTAKIVKAYSASNPSVKLFSFPKNRGRGAARAKGVESALGDYIAFIDADIILPQHWLRTCFSFMNQYDSVGGIAVPDGDVNYVYTKFNLIPKIASHSTVVTGSNGLYKKAIFENYNFDANLRDGEDVAFNHQMISNNFKIFSINSLIVAHKEAKTFKESMRWLYQSGLGASRELKQFKKIRLPDLAYFGFFLIFLISFFGAFFLQARFLLLAPLICILIVSIFHMKTKFVFYLKYTLNYIGAVLVNGILIFCYFAGRTVGIFTAKVLSTPVKKNVVVCFDFEGKFGMPLGMQYDLVKTGRLLLEILKKNNVKAVFFVVGKIIEENPDLIKEISVAGHEIGLHGYSHEDLCKLRNAELSKLDDNLSRVESLLEKLTGKVPTAFRAPFLMAPKFYTPELYKLLEKHSYKWASNRGLIYTEELFFNYIKLPFLWGKNNWLTQFIFISLNAKFILNEEIYSGKNGFRRILANLHWLVSGAKPFMRGDIVEVPLYSPLDGNLLGYSQLGKETSESTIEYAINCLTAGINREGELYMLNFHDWVIGTGNRPQIIERVLKELKQDSRVSFSLSPFSLVSKKISL